MKYRLVVLDIDGTIAGPDFTLTARLKAAVAAVQATGALVTLATGRMFRSARRFAAELGIRTPIVCYQGALIADPVAGTYRRCVTMTPELGRALIDALARSSAEVNVYVDDELYVLEPTEWSRGYAERMQMELRVVERLEPLASRRPIAIVAVDAPPRIADLVARLSARFDGRALITHSLPHFCECASPEAGKHAALDALSSMTGIAPAETVAFGDGPGDAEMLRWAGLGVAIEGGHPDCLAAGQRVVPGPREHGVAELLETMLRDGRFGRG